MKRLFNYIDKIFGNKEKEMETMSNQERDSFDASKESWDILAEFYNGSGNIVFTYNITGGGAMIICLNREFDKVGLMPFGGSPQGRIYVGIFQKGFDHFAHRLAGEANADSLQHRLGLDKVSALAVAELFKELSPRINVEADAADEEIAEDRINDGSSGE